MSGPAGHSDPQPASAHAMGKRAVDGTNGLVLVSWNVHGWIGSDAARDPARCFDLIRDVDADVVALQEVEGVDWERLAEQSGYRVFVQRTGSGDFGNALLARHPLRGVEALDLSLSGRERRGAIDAVVDTPLGALRVVTAHLGLRGYERRRQAERLASHLRAKNAALPTALLGDLNDWTPWGGQLAPLARAVGPLSRVRTFPSRRPVLALDRAALRAPGVHPHVAAVRRAPARTASDHLPLRLELRIADSSVGNALPSAAGSGMHAARSEPGGPGAAHGGGLRWPRCRSPSAASARPPAVCA